MKLGRYEYGYILLIIALGVAWFPAQKFFYATQFFNTIPKWLLGTFYMIASIAIYNLYLLWFLRYVCGKKINRWIKAHGFTYAVGGFPSSKARIRGQYHNISVLIELWHVGRFQDSWIKCQVENPNRVSFTLSRKYFPRDSSPKGYSSFDPYFDDTFQVKPTSTTNFSDASLTDRLVEIQETTNVIDVIKLDKNELFLYYRGLITKEEMLDGALEAISLIANSLQ